MPQSLMCLYVHVVFSTKGRAPLITAELQPRLYEYMGGILRADKNCLLAAGGIADHVHLLVSLSREMAVADTVRAVKALSSKWIHETFPEHAAFAWQAGYGVFGVSFSQRESVKGYVARQEKHHGTQSFQDEYRALLRRHEIEYDERYVWD